MTNPQIGKISGPGTFEFAPNSVENAVINVGGGVLPYAGGTLLGLIKGFSQQGSGDTYNTGNLNFAENALYGPSFGERLAGWLSSAGQSISEWFGGPTGQTGSGPSGATVSKLSTGLPQTVDLTAVAQADKGANWSGTPQVTNSSLAGRTSDFTGLSAGNAVGASVGSVGGNFTVSGDIGGFATIGDYGAQQASKGGF